MSRVKRFINRLAWRVVRATAAPRSPRTVCMICGRHHRSQVVAARCVAKWNS